MPAIDLSDLQYDGDTIELPNGQALRLRIECDQDASVMDEEFYGEFGWVERSRDYVWHKDRPENFDGNAEILWTASGDPIWWQPPRGDYEMTAKRGSKEFADFRSHVQDLISWGFKEVGLELLVGTDAYRRSIVVDTEWIGYIDSIDDGYLSEIVSELWHEMSQRISA